MMSPQYRVSQADLEKINEHLMGVNKLLERILSNPIKVEHQTGSNGASSVRNASHDSSAASSNRKAETGRLQSGERTRDEAYPAGEAPAGKLWVYKPGEFDQLFGQSETDDTDKLQFPGYSFWQ